MFARCQSLVLLPFLLGGLGFLQPLCAARPAKPAARPIAFVDVTLLPMTSPSVLHGQTVIVGEGRILQVGPSSEVIPPKDALRIEGAGRVLLPGLVDSHVHLDALVAPRPDFGDAPLFLAHGVTSVINLRGDATHLDWRRRIQEGALLAPNLYTSGEFVNEPRVRTPDEVAREVLAQKQAGYDLIKFRQVVDGRTWETLTTQGLDRETYLRLNEVARQEGMPLVGHAPEKLGLEALLEARQDLAHLGEFNILHFLPERGHLLNLKLLLGGLTTLLLVLLARGGRILWRKWRSIGAEPVRTAVLHIRFLTVWTFVCAALSLVYGLVLLPGGKLAGNLVALGVYSVLGLVMAALALALAGVTVQAWLEGGTRFFNRLQGTLGALAAILVAVSFLTHWIPVAWRSSPAGMNDLAARCKAAGIRVQSTMFMYQQAIELGGREASRHREDPSMAYLPREKRQRWAALPPPLPPVARFLFAGYPAFTRRLATALHRAGVPLLAGTDVYGVPMLIPGRSLHQELRVLSRCGMSPFEVIQSATTLPAAFLHQEKVFGKVVPGMRADLLLVAANPLEDLSTLEKPEGVMVRGVWLPQERLQDLLEPLRK